MTQWVCPHKDRSLSIVPSGVIDQIPCGSRSKSAYTLRPHELRKHPAVRDTNSTMASRPTKRFTANASFPLLYLICGSKDKRTVPGTRICIWIFQALPHDQASDLQTVYGVAPPNIVAPQRC